MKILELRFQNLNSLYGEWFIDFTDPEYISSGIFALTGPTGAGKSTILDAICLALYGATPRLGKITKSGNEIMSRGTGECYAEVLFESQAGRFRCHWAQHRARKRSAGELQNPQHEISEGVANGRVIEHQLKRVAAVIEENTGMDFERFTRSILLAQGGFDTFLKADAEQKSRILEQITGTEIYTEISRRVHGRRSDERDKLNILRAENSGIVILEPEQEEEIRQELEGKQRRETEFAAKADAAGKAIAWLNGIDGLRAEIGSLTEESGKLRAELEAFWPDRERLGRALKAAELGGDYATLTAVRKQQDDDRSSLKREEAELPELEASAGQKAEALETAEQETVRAKEDLKQAAPIIRNVRSLDQTLAEQKEAVAAGEEGCKKDAAAIDLDKRHKLEEQEKRDAAGERLKRVEEYLEKHSRDEWLVGGLAGIEEQFGSLLSRQREIAGKADNERNAANNREAVSAELDGCIAQLSSRKKAVEDAVKSLERGRKELSSILGDRLLREYRDEKENLLREMAFLAKIAELEDHRSKLEDGKPCPLCGAEEHPFAEGNIPEPDKTEKRIKSLSELIKKAEERESIIKKLEEAEKEALMNLSESEKLEAAAANEKRSVEIRLTDLDEDLKKTRSGFAELKNAVLDKLRPLGIEEIPDSDVSSLLKSLRERLREWQIQVKKKAEMEKQLSDLDSELKRLDAVIETRGNSLAEKQTVLETARNENEAGKSERQELFGNKSPDAEESRLNKVITYAEQAEKQARTARDAARQKLDSTRTNIASLKDRIEERVSELKKLESDFEKVLQPAGFADEKQFMDARLETPERDDLKRKKEVLDHRKTELKARQKDRESRLSIEMAKNVTDSKLGELEAEFKDLEESLKQLRDAVAGLKHKLAGNIAAKKRIREKQASIDVQKKECQRWDKLHGLIGSADGKKYRNFAQGLTFELMVSHANRQLEKMTDRYLLIRDEERPLELNVIDNYQAGEIRSTKNLSGGESFIVSLTLALGLSKMASRNVRVDSLFLDEGFGTLDEDTLETALETLAGLQQDGKLIGIISHVSALKDRISTQINVTPVSGGKSTLSGPGCSNVVAS